MPKQKQDASDTDRWLEAAADFDGSQNPLRSPFDVALDEATRAAKFVRVHWEPKGDVPGLSRVAARLPKKTADDLVSQIHAVQQAQTRFLLVVDPAVVEHGERARFLVDELESAIAFTLDDGVEEPADEQLAQLREFHSQDGQRSSALAQALRDYGTLAKSLKARIAEADAEFDTRLVGEALALADTLAAAPAADAGAEASAVADARAARNRLLGLMSATVATIRKTASHVYRKHPDVLREVTSAHDRRRRAAARRAKAAAEKDAAPDA
jgi:hypothetical protein